MRRTRLVLYASIDFMLKAESILQEIFALSTFLQHNLPCHCNCHNLSCVVEDCNMSEYSNNWPDSIFPNVNPHLSPQSDPIRESPDRSDTFWATLPASLSRPHGTANIFETSNTEAYALPMTDSLRSTQGPLNWHIAPQQDLSGSAFESFNTSMPSDLWLGESNNTEVRFHRSVNLDLDWQERCASLSLSPLRPPRNQRIKSAWSRFGNQFGQSSANNRIVGRPSARKQIWIVILSQFTKVLVFFAAIVRTMANSPRPGEKIISYPICASISYQRK